MLLQKHQLALFSILAIGIHAAHCDASSVREGDLGEYARAHSTALAIGPDNTIFLAASLHQTGEESPLAKIYLWSSNNAGQSWTSASKVSDSLFEDVAPGIGFTSKGSLLVNYSTSLKWALASPIEEPSLLAWWDKVKSTPLSDVNRSVNFWMRRSTDGGQTWSEPFALPCNPSNGAKQLADGSIFLFGQRSSDSIRQMIGGERNSFILTSAVSEDDGLSWKKLKDLAAVDGDDLISTSLQEISYAENDKNDIVVLQKKLTPPDSEVRQFEISEADKAKWTSSRNIGSAQAIHLASLNGDRLLLSYVNSNSPKNLAFKISSDGGKTWTEAGDIVSGNSNILNGFSSAQLNDGMILTVWFEDSTQGKARLRYKVWTI